MRLKKRVEALEWQIGAISKQIDALPIEMHHRCGICDRLGHRSDMVCVHRAYAFCWLDKWVCTACLPGSKYERRKQDVKPNPKKRKGE